MNRKNSKSILREVILFSTALIIFLSSCSKMDYYYKDLVEMGDRIYVGKPDSTWVYPGKNRLKLNWTTPSDPSATKIIVYWNNNKDSVLAAIDHGKEEGHLFIEGLTEETYTIKIFIADNKGNRSVPIERTAEVYGDNFQNKLRNRDIGHAVILKDSVVIFWNEVFEEDPIVSTEVLYYDLDGKAQKTVALTKSRQTSLYNADTSREISIKNHFLPEPMAVDTFSTEFDQTRIADLLRNSLVLTGTGTSTADYIDFSMVTVHDNSYGQTNPERIDLIHVRGSSSRHNLISIANSAGLTSFSAGLGSEVEEWDVRNDCQMINMGNKAISLNEYNALDEKDRSAMKNAFENATGSKSKRLTQVKTGDIILLNSVDREIYVAIKVIEANDAGNLSIEFKISRF